MKKWSVFIGGRPYIVEAESVLEDGNCLMLVIAEKIIGRFMWAKIDGYMEVK